MEWPRASSWDSWGTVCTAASTLAHSQLGIDTLIGFGSGVACGQGTGQQWVNGHTTETVTMMSSSFSGLGTGVPGRVLALSSLLPSPTTFGGCPVPFTLVQAGGVVGGSKWWCIHCFMWHRTSASSDIGVRVWVGWCTRMQGWD